MSFPSRHLWTMPDLPLWRTMAFKRVFELQQVAVQINGCALVSGTRHRYATGKMNQHLWEHALDDRLTTYHAAATENNFLFWDICLMFSWRMQQTPWERTIVKVPQAYLMFGFSKLQNAFSAAVLFQRQSRTAEPFWRLLFPELPVGENRRDIVV